MHGVSSSAAHKHQKAALSERDPPSGITWDARTSRWRVRIKLDGVTYHGGRFPEIEEARRSRNELARMLYGDDAVMV